MNPKLDTIIFDLGNVIVDVDARVTHARLAALGVEEGPAIFTLQQQAQLCDEFETGRMDASTFLQQLQARVGAHIDQADLKHAWEGMVLETRAHRLGTLKQLRAHYQVFCLSNTNRIHYDYLNAQLQAQYGIDQLDSLFDRAYYSFTVGHRKPDVEIYQYVIDDAQIDPSRTLFIDDLPANLVAPAKLGWQTWHAADREMIWQRIRTLLPTDPES